ncbi:hypothetical protein GIB67_005711 [Kingdonia uniflora]|uniref:Uncharacterized protein n=1 Tax=Kingdonia uniflora TaxID=39325 RepID=A0A7J7KVB9_9MAGN|nr:hypothetical protein GIB67_005711 [Kingdonia uniflora]
MLDDKIKVRREVNLEAISSEYGGGLIEWKNGDEKVNVVEKDGEDSKQQTVVVYYNGKKDVQHGNETMVVEEVVKTDILFLNQEEGIGKAYQASADQITVASVEEQTMEVTKTEVVISHQEEDINEAS